MAGFKSGLFWGAFFGGLAGLMNAPHSGKVTRHKIKQRIDQTTDDVNDFRYKLDNLNVAVSRLMNEGVDSINQTSRELQESISKFEDEAQPRIRRIQEKAETLSQNIEISMKKDSN